MRLNLKSVDVELREIDVPDNGATVGDVRAAAAAAYGKKVNHVISNGCVLKDDAQLLADIGVSTGTLLIVMLAKPKRKSNLLVPSPPTTTASSDSLSGTDPEHVARLLALGVAASEAEAARVHLFATCRSPERSTALAP